MRFRLMTNFSIDWKTRSQSLRKKKMKRSSNRRSSKKRRKKKKRSLKRKARRVRRRRSPKNSSLFDLNSSSNRDSLKAHHYSNRQSLDCKIFNIIYKVRT